MKHVRYLSMGALLLMTLWTATVQAADLISAHMICDTNGDGIYAGPGETAGGTVRITTAGDLRFKLSGLEPNKTYTCNLSCSFNLSHTVFSQDCVADSHGRLNVVFAGVATP